MKFNRSRMQKSKNNPYHYFELIRLTPAVLSSNNCLKKDSKMTYKFKGRAKNKK